VFSQKITWSGVKERSNFYTGRDSPGIRKGTGRARNGLVSYGALRGGGKGEWREGGKAGREGGWVGGGHLEDCALRRTFSGGVFPTSSGLLAGRKREGGF